MDKINDFTKLSVFDFDGTLINTPLSTLENKQKWSEHYGREYPYIGWWGREESMDKEVFDITSRKHVMSYYINERRAPNTMVVMLTGRPIKLSGIVEDILKDNNMYFHKYLYNRGGKTISEKIIQILDTLKENPTIKNLEMWDDRVEHIPTFKDLGEKLLDSGAIEIFNINYIKSEHH